MDEDKEAIKNETNENECSEEESHKKEGAVHGEGLESTHIKKDAVEEQHITTTENGEGEEKGHPKQKEKKADDRIDGAEKDEQGKSVRNVDKDGKEDQMEMAITSAAKEDTGGSVDKENEEVKEEKICKNVNRESKESEKSREVLKVASDKAHEIEVQEMMNRNIEDLKRSSVEMPPPEEGNVQLQTQDQTGLVANLHKHSGEEHHDIKLVSGETTCDQSKELLSEEQDKKICQVSTSTEQPVVVEVGETQVQHNTDKTVPMDSTGHVKESLGSLNGIKEIKNEEIVTEVKGVEVHTENKDMDRGDTTVSRTVSVDKNLVQTRTVLLDSKEGEKTIHEQTTTEMEKRQTDNKVKEENNAQDFGSMKEGRKDYENIGQQKEIKSDKKQSDSSSPTQKSSINEGRDGVQRKQIHTPEEIAAKSIECNENVKTTTKLPDNKEILQDINKKSGDMTTTGRQICTVFQETVPGRAKCEESIQRSEIMHSRHNEDSNNVKVDCSSSTEAAINNQLKQLECGVQLSPRDQQKETQKQQQHPQNQQKETQKQQQHPQNQQETQKQQQHPQNQQKETQKQQQHPQNQQQQNQTVQRKQHQGKSATEQNEKQQTEKVQQELNKQKQQTQEIRQPQMQKTENSQKQKEVQQCMQFQKQEEQRKQKEQDQTGKEKPSNDELQYQKVRQSQQEWACDIQTKLQHQQPTQQHKSKQLQQTGQGKQLTQQQDEEHKEQKSKPERHQLPEEGESEGGAGCGGMQGRSCPIYFGVRSYLHQFYDSTSVKNSHVYEDYAEEDDFEYAVDPIKSRGCRKCCRGFWFRAGLWGGINLILVGVITLLVGYLTPQREMIIGHHNNLEIVDRTAIAFNRRLELCRLAGLAVFCCGGVVLLCTLLLSTFLHIGGHNNNGYCCNESAYYGYVTTSLVEPFISGQNQGSNVPATAGIKIPITEQIKSVQPTLWPDAAAVKDGTLLPHMP